MTSRNSLVTEDNGQSRPVLLLCVADEESSQLMQGRLEQAGYGVDTVHDGGEGVATYNPAYHDLLVVEYQLPVYDGPEMIELLATRGMLPPTLMLFNDDEEQASATTLEAPRVDDYMIKDSQQRYLDLLPAVVEHIRRKRNLGPELQAAALKTNHSGTDKQEQQVLAETLRWASTVMLSTYINYDEVLDQIIERIGRVMPHDAVCLMLVEGSTARVARWRGYRQFNTETAIATATFEIAEVASLRTAQKTGRPLAVPYADAQEDWIRQSGQHWVKSYITIPIGTSQSPHNGEGWEMQKLICFLNVDSAVAGFFSQLEAERLQAFANQAAIALENARLYDEARRTIVDRVRALKKERNFISTILETASALIVILNPRGRILRFNRTCEQVTGYSADDVRGKHIWSLFIKEDEAAGVKAYIETLPHRELPYKRESYWLARSGERRLIAWSDNVLFDSSGAVEYIISTGIDITERKQMEEALRASEERYALIALSANDGLWDWNLTTNEIYFSSRWKGMLGYTDEEIEHNPLEWFSRVHPDDLEQLKADIALHLTERSVPFRNEHRLLHRNGTYRWVLGQGLAVWNETSQPYRMAGSLTDITQRKMTEEKLIHRAFHDALTGLPNRVFFRERLERAIERGKEDGNYTFAVLFLDLDRFKVINDNLGHSVGDQLLIEIGRRLKGRLRSRDTVARLGGDEFAILLDGISDDDEATSVAERVQESLARPVELENQKFFITTSIGIALSTIGYEWPEEILRDADMAMYQAKTSGRAHHEMFKIGMRTDAVAVWQLEANLRRAVEQEAFQLLYQPIVSLASGRIVGVETLLRWEDPQRGLIPPEEFIPVAEEIGLINAISTWLLKKACLQARAWRRSGYDTLRMSVNIFPYHLQQCFQSDSRPAKECLLPELIKEALQESGLTADTLILEITENPKLSAGDAPSSALDGLNDLGVSIAVDDFGMGSSLDFLKRLPIDTLKIGPAFITDMVNSAGDQAFVTAIVAMARSLALRVVAQGVTSYEQIAFLQVQGCHEAQGEFFSPPLPAEGVTELLRSGKALVLGTRGGNTLNGSTGKEGGSRSTRQIGQN